MMAKGRQMTLLLFLALWTAVACQCPPNQMVSIGKCSFITKCESYISDVSLPKHCRGSPNYPVKVQLILTNAAEEFDQTADRNFISSVVVLRATGNWIKTSLPFLQSMPKLQKLYLSGSQIETLIDQPFYPLDHLEEIDLSNNKISNLDDIFQFENSQNKLTRLSLAHNNISDISATAFEQLTSLIELDLSYNRLMDLTVEPFSNLTKLQVLRLNDNMIRDLNGAVNELHDLKHLYLKGNQLQNIDPESLHVIQHLQTFDVSGNGLFTLQPSIFLRHWMHLESKLLCKIILSENNIQVVPNATSKDLVSRYIRSALEGENIDAVTDLDLSNNKINKVEYNAFQSILRLKYLDLSNNELDTLYINPEDLIDLMFLNLSGNSIKELNYETLKPMKNLHNLDLSYNEIENISHDAFVNNHMLVHVIIANNRLKAMDRFYLPMIRTHKGLLDLSYNELDSISCPNSYGLRINKIILNSNNITDVSYIDLYRVNNLTSIELNHNGIKTLDMNSLRLPVSLLCLELNNNVIHDIKPSAFHLVSNLVTLRMSHNRLDKLTYGMFNDLRELRILDLSFNKINVLESKVFNQLKKLQVLSLRYNNLHYIDYREWSSHVSVVKVYLDGNSFKCNWLHAALNDFLEGYSRMKPETLIQTYKEDSVDGIPCANENKELASIIDAPANLMIDEKILLTSQNILRAIGEQNYFIRKLLLQDRLKNHDWLENSK